VRGKKILLLVFGVLLVTAGILSPYYLKNNKETVYQRETVEFKVNEKPKPLTLPSQTPLVKHHLDKNGIIVAYLPDGKEVYNVFEIATQAMEGEKVLGFIKNNNKTKNVIPFVPREEEDGKLSDMQVLALRWLENNGKKIEDGLIWEYKFDNAYNDVQVKAPWPSAFGQAHVIKAFLSAYKETKQEKYKELAIKTAYTYDIPIKKGGFKSILQDGSVFFEEVPTEKPTHILNGHMISTVALLELTRITDNKKIKRLASQGLETIKKYIDLYDTGYWSKYDLNPKKGEIILRVAFDDKNMNNNPVMSIDKITFQDMQTGKEVILDIGREDDFSGAWRISGSDWLSSLDNDKAGRILIDGRNRNKQPVKGGTTMNTYIIMQLPEWETKLKQLEKPFDVKVNIRYQDLQRKDIKVQIQNINQGNYLDFIDIPDAKWRTTGDKKWKSYEFVIPSKHLGWYMGVDYQKYHIRLLEELYQFTNDLFFMDIAERWRTYLETYSENDK
jgi:hypothetical protein